MRLDQEGAFMSQATTLNELDEPSRVFYVNTIRTLQAAQVPFLVGGAYAFQRYTGVTRHTKDLDLFVRPGDIERALAALKHAGYATEITFPHWLGKAYSGDNFADLIFKSGNGVSEVDDTWFAHAVDETVLDVPVKLCPPEEMLWTKMYIMERERFDGADVAHVLHAMCENLNWQRLLRYVDEHWRVLLSHLILFGFIYPAERARIPAWLMRDLIGRLQGELTSNAESEKLCQGTFLSRAQYLIDIEQRGYRDARIRPIGNMTRAEISQWTAAIEDEA